MSYRIGIDIGSTTVKVVVLDEQNTVLFRAYERHYSKARERACETLRGLKDMLAGQDLQLLITGSAGLGVGVEFKITPWLGLYLDPSFRYYFRPDLQPRSLRTIQPLRFDLEAGLRFSLGK